MAGAASFDRDRAKGKEMTRLVLMIIGLGCIAALADEPVADKIAEHTAKAEREDPAKRGEIYADIANEYVALAKDKFAAGESDPGKDAISKSVEYARKAADSAKMKGKQIKKTEIRLRQCTTHLEDLARTVSVLDRDPVKAAIKQIDDLRSQLLDAMFKKK
jgi:hypothetical protein